MSRLCAALPRLSPLTQGPEFSLRSNKMTGIINALVICRGLEVHQHHSVLACALKTLHGDVHTVFTTPHLPESPAAGESEQKPRVRQEAFIGKKSRFRLI